MTPPSLRRRRARQITHGHSQEQLETLAKYFAALK